MATSGRHDDRSPIYSIDTVRLIWYDSYRTMNTDEKILQALATLQADVTALKTEHGKRFEGIEKRQGRFPKREIKQ